MTHHETRTHPLIPSATIQLLRLARVHDTQDIGKAGPVLAALAMESDSDNDRTPEENEHLHLYEAVFGRDSLRTASFLLDSYPELARRTLLSLAESQGVSDNPTREEEPGRIIHEERNPNDPIAQKLTAELGWQWPYYGAVDTAAEFIRLLASYIAKVGNGSFLTEHYIDRAQGVCTMADSLERAVGWIEYRRSQNPEGFIEFKAAIPQGIENQVWKDSWDSYHHADGTLANHERGIASIEVQVAAYDALLDAADIYEQHLQNFTHSASLRAQARDLGDAIIDTFWTEDKGGYFVLGLDRAEDDSLRQLNIRTSNMGHVLNSRLLESNDPEIARKRTAVVSQLLSPELLCDAGIRTLASDEQRFRPGSYHNGSVWPWDTHYIAKGLRRHGYEEAANLLDTQLVTIANQTGMFPEYVRGEQTGIHLNEQTIVLWDEKASRKNVIEQPPQEVQAWSVAAVFESQQHHA